MSFEMPAALKARRTLVTLRGASVSGGRSLSGVEQRVMRDAGYWSITLSEVVVKTREQAWAWQAMHARLRQGEPMIVTLCDPYRAPLDPANPVTLVAAAALRASVVDVVGTLADLAPGQRFSISGRLHQIVEVQSETSARVGLVLAVAADLAWSDGETWRDDAIWSSRIRFAPPLRAPAPAGAVCDFRTLRVLVRLDDMASGDLDLEFGRFARPSLSLVEHI